MIDVRDIRSIYIPSTSFVWKNLEGDPERDAYGNSDRNAGIIIPNEPGSVTYTTRDGVTHVVDDAVAFFIDINANVKHTNPTEKYPEERSYVKVKANYNSEYPPVIKMKLGDGPMTEYPVEALKEVDFARVRKVKVLINPWLYEKKGTTSLYITKMSCWAEVGYDPRFDEDEEDIPFC